jgi:rubrerythrin
VKTKKLIFLFVLPAFCLSCNQQPEKAGLQSLGSLTFAIEAEVTANAKYLFYAEQALADSQPQIALLFEAAAVSEKAHADRQITMLLSHGGTLGKIRPDFPGGEITDNLQNAIETETYEVLDMYPRFIGISRSEKLPDVTETFKWALKAEEKHRDLFSMALASLENPGISLPEAYVICPRCGNTMDAVKQSDPCDICGNEASKYVLIEQ